MRAFVAVIEEGTLSAAARRLGATQPTLGRQVRDLEALSGEVLFVRRGHKLEPTPHALSLLPHAREIERGIADLELRFRHTGEGAPREKITLTAPTLLADELLPHVLPEMRQRLPRTAIEIFPSDSLEDIYRRRVDLALRLVRPTQPDVIALKLGRIRVGLCASKSYIERHGSPVAPADLARHTLVLPSNDVDLELGMTALGLEPSGPHVLAKTDDLRTRLSMARSGLGISTCHNWIVDRDDTLTHVLPDLVLAEFKVWLVATDDLQRSTSLRHAWDGLIKAVGPYFA